MQRLFTTLLLIVTASAAQAQTQTPSVTDSYRADIKELLQVSGALKLGEQLGTVMGQQMINVLRTQQPGAPERMFDIVKEVATKFMNDYMNSPELADGMAQAYAKYFTQEEIRQVITFYKTPIGTKLAANQSLVSAELQTIMQSRIPQLIPQLQQDLMRRFAAEGLPMPK